MKPGPIKKLCIVCQAPMWIWPHQLETRQFCSVKCRKTTYRVKKNCPYCGSEYDVIQSQYESAKTCRKKECIHQHRHQIMLGNRRAAGHQPNRWTFPVGHTPWTKKNKGKGLHLSPLTEFKKGQVPRNKVPVGTIKIRHFKRNNESRAFIKIAEPSLWKLNALYVWEKHHGPIPHGFLVHHKDRNPLNDSIENLAVASRSDHLKIHWAEIYRKPKISPPPLLMKEKAVPLG